MKFTLCIMDSSLPNWTEFAQVIIGSVGMVAAIIGAVKLIKRDKDRESEVTSLSSIAGRLTDLISLNERAYLESKIPRLTVECQIDDMTNGYFIYITNKNINGRITNYSCKDRRDYTTVLSALVSEMSGEQKFSFNITTNKEKDFTIDMTYTVDKKYIYAQEIFVFEYKDKFVTAPRPIEFKEIIPY
jgi:hypothetical protein